MVLDIGPVLRRLILAASPLIAAGCGDGNWCATGDLRPGPDETFDLKVVVFEDDSFTVVSGRPTPPTRPAIDWGRTPPDAGSGLRGMFMPIELRDAYDRCARLRGFSCADFCRQITQLWFRGFEVKSCEAIEGGPPDRPAVRIAGLGTNG